MPFTANGASKTFYDGNRGSFRESQHFRSKPCKWGDQSAVRNPSIICAGYLKWENRRQKSLMCSRWSYFKWEHLLNIFLEIWIPMIQGLTDQLNMCKCGSNGRLIVNFCKRNNRIREMPERLVLIWWFTRHLLALDSGWCISLVRL